MDHRIALVLLSLAVVAAGCTGSTPGATPDAPLSDDAVGTAAVQGGSGGGGGSVLNSAPSVRSFTADRTTGENDGAFVVTFSGTVFDPNTENQVATIAVAATGPAGLLSNHTVLGVEHVAADEPAAFGPDGWKVWTASPNDGVLHFKFRQSFPIFAPPGAYVFRAVVTDHPGEAGVSTALPVTLARFSLITVSGAPVDLQGAPLVGQNWGQWSAQAGAQNVTSTNYLKLVNDGDDPAARVVVDFTEPAFRGASDGNFSVPLDGNVQFAWFEDTTPATTAPSEKPFAFGATSPNGGVSLTFTGKGHVIYVAYRLVMLPDVLPVQSYGSTFTVTEL